MRSQHHHLLIPASWMWGFKHHLGVCFGWYHLVDRSEGPIRHGSKWTTWTCTDWPQDSVIIWHVILIDTKIPRENWPVIFVFGRIIRVMSYSDTSGIYETETVVSNSSDVFQIWFLWSNESSSFLLPVLQSISKENQNHSKGGLAETTLFPTVRTKWRLIFLPAAHHIFTQ